MCEHRDVVCTFLCLMPQRGASRANGVPEPANIFLPRSYHCRSQCLLAYPSRFQKVWTAPMLKQCEIEKTTSAELSKYLCKYLVYVQSVKHVSHGLHLCVSILLSTVQFMRVHSWLPGGVSACSSSGKSVFGVLKNDWILLFFFLKESVGRLYCWKIWDNLLGACVDGSHITPALIPAWRSVDVCYCNKETINEKN